MAITKINDVAVKRSRAGTDSSVLAVILEAKY